ncbi:MAG: hypothetical protein E7Z91_02670 [Cyanobacteria bacterium SIG30]|nr:hypothetical protein [Cyanobacteria bacterium SIG30]
MIATILIFPIIACFLLLFIKNKFFANLMVNLYAIVHFALSLLLVFNLAEAKSIPYFGIDNLNGLFLLVLSFIFLMVAIYNNGYVKNFGQLDKKINKYSLMVLIFVFSMTGAILAQNLGIAWIFIEATTLSSAYLIYFNKTKHSIEAAWKYVFICSIGIALAFVGIIFLNIGQGELNTLDFTQLYKYAKNFDPFWLKLSFVFMLFGFGTKMGLAPVHFWLPDAHSEAPSPISALLSATLLNSAFLIIIRVFKILNIMGVDEWAKTMLYIMGILSIFVTAVFVYHIKNYKRMLAYSSIENMGILALGTAIGGGAIYAVILHIIGHSLAKASFFLTSGNVLELFETKRIKSVKGLNIADSKTAWLWIVSFLGICAFPTSLLFISEFLIIKTMFLNKQYIICALFVILLTIILWGMGRVVISMSFGKLSDEKNALIKNTKKKLCWVMYLPQIIMLILVFVLGVYIPPFLNDIIKLTITGF